MSVVTLSSTTIEKWEPTGKTVELWIFSKEAWLSSDDKIHLSGSPEMPGIFRRVLCHEDAQTLTISATAIDSTTNARVNPDACYLAFFYTVKRNKGTMLRPFDLLPDPFTVPPIPMLSWDDLTFYNRNMGVIK
jgi:hypothetical protein